MIVSCAVHLDVEVVLTDAKLISIDTATRGNDQRMLKATWECRDYGIICVSDHPLAGDISIRRVHKPILRPL